MLTTCLVLRRSCDRQFSFWVSMPAALLFWCSCDSVYTGDSTVGKSALAQCFSSGGVDRATQFEMVRELFRCQCQADEKLLLAQTTTTQLYTATVETEGSQKVELYLLETPGQSVFSAGHNGQVGVSCLAKIFQRHFIVWSAVEGCLLRCCRVRCQQLRLFYIMCKVASTGARYARRKAFAGRVDS